MTGSFQAHMFQFLCGGVLRCSCAVVLFSLSLSLSIYIYIYILFFLCFCLGCCWNVLFDCFCWKALGPFGVHRRPGDLC